MPRGGKRPGAGRPKGTSKYKEPTKMARIPESLAHELVRVAAHGHQPIVADAKELEVALSSFEDAMQKMQNLPLTHDLTVVMNEIQEGIHLIKKVLGLDISTDIDTQLSIERTEQALTLESFHDFSEQYMLSMNRSLFKSRYSLETCLLPKKNYLALSNVSSVLEIEKLHHELGFVEETKGKKRLVLTKTILRLRKINHRLFKVTHVIHRHRAVYERTK
jgi:hypothetical protein